MPRRTLAFHNGARIEWAGWRTSPNQDLSVGWWIAQLPSGKQVAATTLGGIEQAPSYEGDKFSPFRVFDLTVTREERENDHREPSEDSRQRALDRLRDWLDVHHAA